MQKQSQVKIQQLRLSDLAQTSRLFYKTLQPVSVAEVAYYLVTRMSGTFVAKMGNQVVGFYQAIETVKNKPLWFDFFAVSPEVRRQGVGKKLMYHFLEQTTRAGYAGVELSVEKKDLEAIAFYRSYGFLEKSDQKLSNRICFYMNVQNITSDFNSPFIVKSNLSVLNQIKNAMLKAYVRLMFMRRSFV